jgi:hypothetical protein
MALFRRVVVSITALGCVLLWNGVQCSAQKDTASASSDLQKATQNPLASLISVPLQNNTNFSIGPFDRTQNVLNIQPVVRLRASENWNLIIRWIAPIIWQPAPGTTNLEVFGIEESTLPTLLSKLYRATLAFLASET